MGWRTLEATLDRVARPGASSGPALPEPTPADTAGWTASAISAFWAGDFHAVRQAAHRARDVAVVDLDRALASGAGGLAFAGMEDPTWPAPWADAPAGATGGTDRQRSFAQYLLAESALASGRLDLASAFTSAGGRWHQPWLDSPFSVIMLSCRVRTAAFSGRIDDAAAQLPELEELGRLHGLEDLATAVASLVTGNADDADRARAEISRLIDSPLSTEDYVGRGVRLLAAFGAVALGDIEQAATLILSAGDPGLSRLTIIDRALAIELLTAAAIADDDAEAALAWLAQLELMDTSTIAAAVVERTRARVALLAGDAHLAARLAESAAHAARAQGRVVEAAESEVVLARARIATDQVAEAARSLRAAVSQADAVGHRAVRRSATEALSHARRRLPPPRGSGWDSLSPREIEVAQLTARGQDSGDIAALLYLSPATVRVHISRVLAAFGVPTCTALIAVVAPTLPPGEQSPLPPLSPRRAHVVELVAQGWGNVRIAQSLGISVKVVERHVGDALRLWNARGRAQLASMWWAAARDRGS
ncbi:LuxR C-terminal-related transcriptional regulator [uncultured Microbacterium sp.]|uniref:LuxR C-terminal-related transcriptional regulator n=1 Tax=uncultured Microbacterium sp. TaxID=191216 RepID=UPI0035CA478E